MPRRHAQRTATRWTGRRAGISLCASGVPLWLPDHLAHLGDVDRIDYKATKEIDDDDPIDAIWEHLFPQRPPLLCDPSTGTLIIVGHGSRYAITTAGIDDWPPANDLIIPLTAPVQEIADR